MSALGFQPNQIRSFYILEGLVISVFGGLLGFAISVFYTQLVFKILNSLWFEIVRTSVLEIKILTSTLLAGYVIGIVVSLLAIFISLQRFQNRQAVELQKQIQKTDSKTKSRVLNLVMYFTLIISVLLFFYQILSTNQLNILCFFSQVGCCLSVFCCISGEYYYVLIIVKRN